MGGPSEPRSTPISGPTVKSMRNWGTGLALGVAVGVALGAALGNVAFGIGLGMSFAIVFSLMMDDIHRRRAEDEDVRGDAEGPRS